MSHLYASAVGTTVMQIKEIPPRPAAVDGALILHGLRDGVDSDTVRSVLSDFGEVVEVDLQSEPPRVRFASHEAALAVTDSVCATETLCAGVSTVYNEHPYDSRGWARAERSKRGGGGTRGDAQPRLSIGLRLVMMAVLL